MASFRDVLYRGRCTMARWIICKCVCVCVCVCALARWLPLFVFQLCVSLHISNLFQASSTCSKKPVPSSVLIGPRQNKIDAPPCDRPPPHHGTGTADCRVPPWTVHGPTFVGQCIGLTIKLYTKTAMPYFTKFGAVGRQWGHWRGRCTLAARGHGMAAARALSADHTPWQQQRKALASRVAVS